MPVRKKLREVESEELRGCRSGNPRSCEEVKSVQSLRFIWLGRDTTLRKKIKELNFMMPKIPTADNLELYETALEVGGGAQEWHSTLLLLLRFQRNGSPWCGKRRRQIFYCQQMWETRLGQTLMRDNYPHISVYVYVVVLTALKERRSSSDWTNYCSSSYPS